MNQRYYVQITSRRSGKLAVLKFVLRRLWSIAVLMFSVRQECKTFLGEICYRSLSRNCGRVEGNTSSGGAAAATVGDFLTFPAKTALRAPRHHVGNAALARFSAGRDNIHIITLARVVFFLHSCCRVTVYEYIYCSAVVRRGVAKGDLRVPVSSLPFRTVPTQRRIQDFFLVWIDYKLHFMPLLSVIVFLNDRV